METQMYTAGSICVTLFIARDVWCVFFVSVIYMMVMRKFNPVFCISVSITKGIMKLTLVYL